jgi:hypothetical protein
MKLFIYRALTHFFKWLAEVAEQGSQRFDYCDHCGEQKWTSRGCVGRVITYKAVTL